MVLLACLVLGALLGALIARKRGGNKLDIVQYSGVYALIGAIIGLFLTVGLERML